MRARSPSPVSRPPPLPPAACYAALTADANVVDVDANRILSKHTVVIAKGTIKSVEKSSIVTWPDDYRVVDCHGLYLCPGLVDCRECLPVHHLLYCLRMSLSPASSS